MDDLKTEKDELQDKTGLTSEGEKGTSQDTTPETLTREAHLKALSDAKAQMGRELKAAKAEAERFKQSQTALETELTETRERMADIQRRIDEAEEEEAKGSPESLRIYQKQKQLRDQEAQLRQRQSDLDKKALEQEEKLRYADEAKTEMAIISIALESHLDIGELKEAAREFNLTTEEQVSKLAERLSSKKLPPRGDSGKTVGGGSESVDKVRSDYIAGKISRQEYVAKCTELNVQP